MFIKCKLNREGGTKIELDGTEYHFAPNAASDHVAKVTNSKHIKRFLEISEAYEEYGSKAKVVPADDGDVLTVTVADDGDVSTVANDGDVLTVDDINAMGKKELLIIAAEQAVQVNAAAPVPVLRNALITALVADQGDGG